MSTADVSRETPPSPVIAAGIAGERLALLERYAALLAGDGVTRGLIGPREVPRLWDRHLLNCAVAAEAAGPSQTVADVGSGAGLPGLVWAVCRPDLQVTLVEPLLRRCTFLNEAVETLELDNVEVVRGRAEELHRQRGFQVVTSRAVAPLDRLSEWCLPLVTLGGRMVALKGASAHEEIGRAQARIQKLGGGPATVAEYGRGVIDPPTLAVEVERVREPLGRAAAPSRRSGRASRSNRSSRASRWG